LFTLLFISYSLGGRCCIAMALSTWIYYTIWKRLAFLRSRLVRFGPHWTFSSKSSMVPSVFSTFSFLIVNGILLCFPGIKKQLGWYYKSSAAYSGCKWYVKVLALKPFMFTLHVVFHLLLMHMYGFIYAWLHKHILMYTSKLLHANLLATSTICLPHNYYISNIDC
jgi:hypothetical protein